MAQKIELDPATSRVRKQLIQQGEFQDLLTLQDLQFFFPHVVHFMLKKVELTNLPGSGLMNFFHLAPKLMYEQAGVRVLFNAAGLLEAHTRVSVISPARAEVTIHHILTCRQDQLVSHDNGKQNPRIILSPAKYERHINLDALSQSLHDQPTEIAKAALQEILDETDSGVRITSLKATIKPKKGVFVRIS